MKTLKVLSALLTYPTADLIAAGPELKSALQSEGVLPRQSREALGRLIDHLASSDLYEAQERYVFLFDRTRSLSLHLFEHVHGESRDRGQAMIDLIQVYQEGGFSPTAAELPDFVPLFLEYAATRSPQVAIDLVAQPGHVFAALRERLAKRNSPYEAVFAALVQLANGRLDEQALAALRAEPDPEPDDLDALDAAWQDEEVLFGPGAADANCGKDSLTARLRQARRPAPGVAPPSARPQTTITTSPAARS